MAYQDSFGIVALIDIAKQIFFKDLVLFKVLPNPVESIPNGILNLRPVVEIQSNGYKEEHDANDKCGQHPIDDAPNPKPNGWLVDSLTVDDIAITLPVFLDGDDRYVIAEGGAKRAIDLGHLQAIFKHFGGSRHHSKFIFQGIKEIIKSFIIDRSSDVLDIR